MNGAELDSMLAAPARFGFVEAIDAVLAAHPESAPPGGSASPAKEAVRLRPQLELSFPTADVASAERLPAGEDGIERVRIETTFLGAYGQASPLPTYFTERLFADDNPNVRDFIDIFHHRLLSLAWRVMTKYRLARSREHDARIRALVGFPADLGTPELPGGEVLSIAGLLSRQPRSAATLAAAISHWLGGMQVEVEQCTPVWVDLPPERRAVAGQANCGLGTDMLAGDRIFSRTTSFLIVVGPVASGAYVRFLPGGDAMAAITALVAECNPERLDWAVEVVVAGDSIPPSALGESSRLGWDTRADGPPAGDLRIRVSPT